ncbi:SAM-dependent methyltransferase [Actinomadura scrupuli]|uniref:SAM-dependent methyltransferase n=1 Tax=Actinomadura scrupuli TaxID=559629 RepID=UPI003D96F626
MRQREPLRGVGKTALGMARIRAHESLREDRLFDDPYAQAFLDAAPGAFTDEASTKAAAKAGSEAGPAGAGSASSLGGMFAFHGAIRTRFFDDYLLAAADECPQVVLLAAGLDTRAFRLAWPERTRLFELDFPEVLGFKNPVLTGRDAVPRCERTVVPVDLRADWPVALLGAGFDPAVPAVWLAEGLLIYLTFDEAGRLLTSVGELSAPGSRLSFEYSPVAESPLLTRATRTPGMDRYTALWKGGLGEDAPGRLTGLGWRPRFHELAALAASYGRPAPHTTVSGFLTAVRQRTRTPPEAPPR